MTYSNIRTPFIVKDKNDPTLIENELYMDNDNGIIYIYKRGQHVGVSYNRIYRAIENRLIKYIGKLSPNQISELIEEANDLYTWMNDNNSPIDTPESNILNIFKVFDKYDYAGSLISNINKMTDTQPNKSLVTNSFTLDNIIKINSISEDANAYIHPTGIQCNLGPKVESIVINGESRTGNVVITKKDIGYEHLESGANNYTHPKNQVCSAGVVSVNGEKGFLYLDKSDFKIYNIPNAAPATYDDYTSSSPNTFFFGSTAVEYLNDKLASAISRNKTKLQPGYTIELTATNMARIRSVTIGGITNTEFDDNDKMIFRVYHDNVTISIISLDRLNVVIQKIPKIPKNTPLKLHYSGGSTVSII